MSGSGQALYRKHGFTLSLFAVLILALVYPDAGLEGGFLKPEWTTKLGVWIIFFVQGLSLPAKELRRGYRPIRLQVFILSWNYLLFPLVGLVYALFCGLFLQEDLVAGFVFLSILPTTIASAVAFTAIGKGASASAICATVLSNLFAILTVPLWATLYLNYDGPINLPLLPLLAELTLLIAFPMLVGQLLRLQIKSFSKMPMRWVSRMSSGIILYIVYVAFADSAASGQFELYTAMKLAYLVVAVAGLLALSSGLVWLSSAWINLGHSERVAAFFCGSQKSLATGLPLITVIFAALPESFSHNTGAVLIPLILFHPMQLLLAAIVAARLGRAAD